ncbi:MAG: type II toxin-antitoxin system PemK/MazF family toxin [Arachnia sp.]
MAGSRGLMDGVLKVLQEVAERALNRAIRSDKAKRRAPAKPTPKAPKATPKPTAPKRATDDSSYPGDYPRLPNIVYRPRRDDEPDPGEIVWTWVPYEEDHAEGKDRPVLLIGRDGAWLLGLQVTSQDHDRDAAQEARAGRYWIDIGTGEWDPKRRPSEVRVNRIVRIDPDAVRRIGAVLDERVFSAVAAEVRRHYQR